MSEEFNIYMEGEEFDQWLKLITTEIYMNAWCAGAKAQRNKMVEYIRDQGTTWTENGREVYYIIDSDVAYLERMEVK